MKAKVIMNPYAGRWKALENRASLEGALQAAGVDYELTLSERPGHAQELAAQAVSLGLGPILAAGGDGTLSEVVNGMMEAAKGHPANPFGVLPLGTANDLADNLKIPKDLTRAARVIAAGKTRLIDVIKVNDRYFVNNAGLGLEPFVSIIQSQMTWLRGNLRYIVATLRAISRNPRWHMHLEWDGETYEGPITMISVGNCARTGGVFYTVPHADPFDGKLTFIHGFLPTRLKILRALPMILNPAEGNITEHPAVHEIHATWLKVRASSPTPAHADGEVFSRGIQELDYQVLPGRLPVIM